MRGASRWLLVGVALAVLVVGFVGGKFDYRSTAVAGLSVAFAVALGLLLGLLVLLPVGWIALAVRVTVGVRVTPTRVAALVAIVGGSIALVAAVAIIYLNFLQSPHMAAPSLP